MSERYRLLIIDDDPAIHQTYKAMFGEELVEDGLGELEELESIVFGGATSEQPHSDSFQIDSATHGEQGVACVSAALEQQDPYAVILIDMRMPGGMDGLMTAQQIRQLDREVRIIFVTAYMDYSLEEVRDALGAHFDFLTKPVKRDRFYQLVLSQASSWQRFREMFNTNKEEKKLLSRDLKQTQQELEHLQAALYETAIVSVTDADGIITDINQRFIDVSGYSRDELIGKPQSVVSSDDYPPTFYARLWQTISSGAVWMGEIKNCTRQGKPYWVRGSIVPFRNPEGEIYKYISIQGDITDLKRMEEEQRDRQVELVKARNEAERSNRAKDEFIATMSHELRTPLAVIIGNSGLLRPCLVNDPEGEKLRQAIKVSGQSLLALVNDVLDMTKMEAGKLTIVDGFYNLQRLVEEMEAMFAFSVEDAGLQLEVECTVEPTCLLQGDEQRIRQILVNLLNNAIKFTHQGRVQLRVSVVGERLQFEVRDTGIGIDPDTVGQLFNRFQQADSSISRRFGGTGLGLYISRNLAERMGGEITVESVPGEGSCFCLLLPYQYSEQCLEEGLELQEHSSTAALSAKLLMAEDTPLLQQLGRRILERMGCTVTIVGNGLEAVESATRQRYDLILMDLQMPEMDGIEATRQLREHGVETPIVALTANVLQEHREAFDQAGGSGFLTKPIDEQELRQVVDRSLETQAG